MEVNLLNLRKILQTLAQLPNPNSRNPRIPRQLELAEGAPLLHIQLTDLQNGLISNILSLDIKRQMVGRINMLPNAKQVIIHNLNGASIEPLQRKTTLLLDLMFLKVRKILIGQIIKG